MYLMYLRGSGSLDFTRFFRPKKHFLIVFEHFLIVFKHFLIVLKILNFSHLWITFLITQIDSSKTMIIRMRAHFYASKNDVWITILITQIDSSLRNPY